METVFKRIDILFVLSIILEKHYVLFHSGFFKKKLYLKYRVIIKKNLAPATAPLKEIGYLFGGILWHGLENQLTNNNQGLIIAATMA